MRKAIVFHDGKWYVRRIRVVEHDLGRDEKVYRCDQHISGPHELLSDVPEVQELLCMSSPCEYDHLIDRIWEMEVEGGLTVADREKIVDALRRR
jgi:hypothetical protein